MGLQLPRPKAWITFVNPFESVCVARKTRIPLAVISSKIAQVVVASPSFGSKMKLQYVQALAGKLRELYDRKYRGHSIFT